MRKCANISPYMRRPLAIYDFATAPFWISLLMSKIVFNFLSLYPSQWHLSSNFLPGFTVLYSKISKYWPVSDGDDGCMAELPPDGLLYAEVGGRVHGGRRLVQQQDLGPPAATRPERMRRREQGKGLHWTVVQDPAEACSLFAPSKMEFTKVKLRKDFSQLAIHCRGFWS